MYTIHCSLLALPKNVSIIDTIITHKAVEVNISYVSCKFNEILSSTNYFTILELNMVESILN